MRHNVKPGEIHETPPPPLKLTNLLLLLVLLAGAAVPAVAQTTVTSSGRVGPTACLDLEEVISNGFSITEINSGNIRYTSPRITWNQYTGRLGDSSAPDQIDFYVAISNARSKAATAGIRTPVSRGNDFPGNSTPYILNASLSPKTLYYFELYAAPSGSIPKLVFARRCFMTGGSYTMTVAPNTQGQSSGCFTISPLTQQDVRNCWCGRKSTLRLFSATQDNTDFLNMLGCL